ncbi:MAG: ATPase domain-containing protein [Methylocella sp.]
MNSPPSRSMTTSGKASLGIPNPTKAPTGIVGLDEITGGGLPHRRTTLLSGGPGSGKTILALQFLMHGARDCEEPGIFVAFEETSKRIMANAKSFGWNIEELLDKKKLCFIDAQPTPDLVQSGSFDLGGMLAAHPGRGQDFLPPSFRGLRRLMRAAGESKATSL